ncbi:ABC transporter [Streptomyces reniochalinae]|uniref:ABC transporter n=1 Tax=Streptomyces reniochalinae TaxID=2250578 RepID=A0A367ECS0_9ACTN|nr:ABC transporter [Streptomyces reniochalinae]RCG15856.1 ABC transporter [Streptomyces reniochalinae]
MRETLALTRYQLALLVRSQRWLAPLLLYAGLLAVGVRAGDPVLDSLGFAAAALLPTAVWLVRVCVTAEPAAARHCAAAATGPARAHLAGVVAGAAAAAVPGGAAVGLVTAVSSRWSTDGGGAIPVASAVVAGVCGVLTCVAVGTAVGVLCNRPLVGARGYAVAMSLLGTVVALVAGASPARAAVAALSRASAQGSVDVPWVELLCALAVAGLAVCAACAVVGRRP